MHSYSHKLISLFSANADPQTAFWAKKYMRNQYEFFGITSPRRGELSKEYISENGLPDYADLPEIIQDLWTADQRELQYFAMVLPEKFKRKWGIEIIELFENMIVNKSWWDTVDWIASHLVGSYFKKFPDQIIPKTDEWMASGNMWLQRTCILFQLKYKKETDTDLLFRFSEELRESKEFFIQKAIGWALRELSKTNPEAVLAFVNEVELKPLSVREGTRIIYKKKGLIK
jgi:3-methyladenine DNA glycosylase AlkD